MKTFTDLQNLFTNLSQNTSAGNASLATELLSDRQRYLIEKYFDNENTYTQTTIGAMSLTTTASLAIGDTSATLSTAWTYNSCYQLVVFSSGEQRTVYFVQNSTAIRWSTALTETATTAITTVGVQSYPIPVNVSKISNATITIGQLQYTPAPVQSIDEWTRINTIPYTSDIPNYYYIYQNRINFWPIPSTTGNVITLNYKSRVPNFSYSDYSTGTLSGLTLGSNEVTGVSTSWNTTGNFPLNVDLSYANLYLQIGAPSGDALWYPIERFLSDTSLLLLLPLDNAPSSTASTYTIGQIPWLQEDFHDLLVYGALKIYFSSIVKDPSMFKLYENLEAERMLQLEDYAGTKSVNVDLGPQPQPLNPNLFFSGRN